jgi:hypothetical protein
MTRHPLKKMLAAVVAAVPKGVGRAPTIYASGRTK